MNNAPYILLASALSILSACGGQTHLNASGPSSPPPPTIAQSSQLPQPPRVAASLAPVLNTVQVSTPRVTAPVTRPTAVPSKTSAKAPVKAPTTPVKVPTAAVKAPQLSAGQALLAKAVERFNTLNSFKISVEGFETSTEKGPTSLSFQMSSLKGRNKIEVSKHTNALYVGVKMGYQSGTGQISVRPSGVLGFVKVDTQMSDERLLTARGYRLDQIDAAAISQRLLKGNQQPKILGKTQLNGRNIAILEYTHANDFDASITRELLGIDMENYFMRIHEMYEGSKLVFSLKLDNIQLNAPVTEAELEI